MTKRKISLLMAAAMIALITVMLARSMMRNPDAVAPPPVQGNEVIGASRDLAMGTILKPTDLKWIPWVADGETSKLYVKGKTEMTSLVGSILREGVHADEPIVTSRIVQSTDRGFLAAVLAPGKRAVAVTLTPSAGVAGFIFPGDHVDVILTHSFSRKDIADLTERRISETVVTDARVLALDQKSDSAGMDPKVAQLATLEVTPKQAEKLMLAIDLVSQTSGGRGSISLALRSLAVDESAPSKESATIMSLTPDAPTWDSEVSRALPAVNGDDLLIQRVQIMRGKDKMENNFERHR
ncbi:MAG: Flp pilus assembly protein CpaB [Alphaproteobacteria bacterium]|nr:Flp pilus assembly protein CpaB [Alphaproteobacteria bacterium]